MRRQAHYPLDQCALYAIKSPGMLAARLGESLPDLEEIAGRADNYLTRSLKKTSGGSRIIEEPKRRLQQIHGRVHQLLSRIGLPDYVHSVRKGRSYVTNAHAHVGASEMIKLDLEAFYLNVRSGAVAAFFEQRMRCAGDVAALLAKLLTYQGHLPTGSKSSPILSYFAHCKLFDEIHALARGHGLTMTLYVDDIVISGVGAHRGIVATVRQIVANHGLRSHKIRHFVGGRPKIVTGVIVDRNGLKVPNRRLLRIKNGYDDLHRAGTSEDKLVVLQGLCSLVHEAAQVDARYKPSAIHLDRLRRSLRLT